MITIDNYFNKINELDISTFPDALRKGHEFILKATRDGASWTSYHGSETIKKTVDIYLTKLNEFVKHNSKAESKQSKKQREQEEHKEIIKEAMRRQGITNNATKKQEPIHNPTMVERIPEELRFIKRFVNLNGKTKTKEDILRFINSLQKAIVEKRIRKTSPYAEQIRMIQGKLINVYNSMKAKITIELKPDTYEKLKELTKKEKVIPTVNFIKSYINMNGKPGMKKKADQLLKRITSMVDKKKIPSNDPYMDDLIKITKNLETFLDNPSMKVLTIEKSELNGLEGILGCACSSLNGFDERPAIMNSMDFANMQFDTIGLKGKWFDLIGDPSSNFTAMVFGKPKMGKSYLCIEFAGYLARNHGKVLYVAKEEGLDMTLQKKLNDKDVAHPNLYVASELPGNLAAYDFIFLDSVNKLGLTPDDLHRLKSFNPTKSFIFIFQSTKLGAFRGANTFQH
ncbi:MAG: ATP-binding protein, partial [Bacteroidetes bacterium]|nr:ATP-binding protein [Bacteroidota bacterium]